MASNGIVSVPRMMQRGMQGDLSRCPVPKLVCGSGSTSRKGLRQVRGLVSSLCELSHLDRCFPL